LNKIKVCIKRLLISKVNLFGDTVVFLPTLKAILDLNQNSGIDIYILTTPIGKEVISAAFPQIHKNNFFVLDCDINNKNSSQVYSYLERVRGCHIDTAIFAYDDPAMTYYMAFLAGIPRIIGFDNKLNSGQRFLTDKVSFKKSKNVVEINFELARFLAGNYDIIPRRVVVSYNKRDVKNVEKRMLSAGVRHSDKFILIHPFAGHRYKEWSLPNYKKLARAIEDSFKLPVIFVMEAVPLRMDVNNIRVIAGLSIRELAYIFKKARLFIGNNSGPMHLAANMRTPTIILQGPSPKQWDVYYNDVIHSKILAGRIPCASCAKIGCVPLRCRKKINIASCIKEITVEKAFRETARILNKILL